MALSDGEAVEVVDLRNGAYEARVLLNKAGVRRFVGCVDGVPFNSGPIELCVLPNALHAPSCIPYGDAVECFVIAGHTNILKLDGRDKHNNKVPTAGRAWHATLEVLAPDASKWQDAEPHPTVRDDPDAPTGHYRIEILPPHAGPIRLTLRPLSHGIPATEAFTIGFIASPSPADPLAFHVSGEALRVAVAGEPAQLVVRPRSFGDARNLAARTFAGLRAWIALPGGAVDGGARMLPLRLSRRDTTQVMVDVQDDGSSAVDVGDEPQKGLAAENLPFTLPTTSNKNNLGGGEDQTSPLVGGTAGKRRVSKWHGADGSWSLLCTASDLDDVEEWPLHFTAFHASRAAAVHIELFNVPICGGPFPCCVLPAATNAAKSIVSGLARLVRAGEPNTFLLRTRDRFGNDRWSGGDSVRVLLLQASTGLKAHSGTGGSAGRPFSEEPRSPRSRQAAEIWGGIVRSGLWTTDSEALLEREIEPTDSSSGGGGGARRSSAEVAAAVEHANATWVADEDAAAAFDEQLQNDVSPNSRQRARTSEVEHPAPDARELAGAESSLELLEHRGASSNGCDAIDKGDGTYNLTALATVAGKYTVHAFVNGRPAMAPFPYIVKPGQPDPATSELTIGSTRGTIGRWVPLRSSREMRLAISPTARALGRRQTRKARAVRVEAARRMTAVLRFM